MGGLGNLVAIKRCFYTPVLNGCRFGELSRRRGLFIGWSQCGQDDFFYGNAYSARLDLN